MEKGWIKLDRKIEESPIYEDNMLYAFWSKLLFRATYRERKIFFDGKIMFLKPGEFFSSEIELSARLKFDRATVRRCLKFLVENGSITCQRGKKKTIYKIVNYKNYQFLPVDKPTDEPTDTSTDTPTGKPTDTPTGKPTANKKERIPIKKESKKERLIIAAAPNGTSALVVSAEKSLGSKIWDAYAEAYAKVYKDPPIRNAKQNAICKQIGERLGVDSVEVVKHYVLRNRASFHTTRKHQLTAFLPNAESLHNDWTTGITVTSTMGHMVDRQSHNDMVLERALSKWDETAKGDWK